MKAGDTGAAKGAVPREEALKKGDGGTRKSFFAMKLGSMLEQREVDFPPLVIRLLDTPFNRFTVEDKTLNERGFKGRHLSLLLGDMPQELYEKMGRSRYGWEGACRYLEDTPMKLYALYVIQEEERLEQVTESFQDSKAMYTDPMRKKSNVKPYNAAK
ncbi:MAG: hypothetical protein SWK76_07495 [Actinomycetota bacterium]|nr:hypothetical protein [Actinomycetota bacterium]